MLVAGAVMGSFARCRENGYHRDKAEDSPTKRGQGPGPPRELASPVLFAARALPAQHGTPVCLPLALQRTSQKRQNSECPRPLFSGSGCTTARSAPNVDISARRVTLGEGNCQSVKPRFLRSAPYCGAKMTVDFLCSAI